MRALRDMSGFAPMSVTISERPPNDPFLDARRRRTVQIRASHPMKPCDARSSADAPSE